MERFLKVKQKLKEHNIKIMHSHDGGVFVIQYGDELPKYLSKKEDLKKIHNITGLPIKNIHEFFLKNLDFENYSSIKFEIERVGENTNEIEKLKQKYNLQNVSFLYEFIKARILRQKDFHAINVFGKNAYEFVQDIDLMSFETSTPNIDKYFRKKLKISFMWIIVKSYEEKIFRKIRQLNMDYQLPNIVIVTNKPSPFCENIEINEYSKGIAINPQNLWFEVTSVTRELLQ